MGGSAEDYMIKAGLDDEDYFLLWPVSEWVIGVAVLGVLATFQHILLGIGGFMLALIVMMKLRANSNGKKALRGSMSHFLWRLNLLKSKKGLRWAPPAHSTRFDN